MKSEGMTPELLEEMGKILFTKLGGIINQDGRIVRHLLHRIKDLEEQVHELKGKEYNA